MRCTPITVAIAAVTLFGPIAMGSPLTPGTNGQIHGSSPKATMHTDTGPTETPIIRHVLRPVTVYTDALPAGYVRTITTTHDEVIDGSIVRTVHTTLYRRPYQPVSGATLIIPELGLRARIVEGVTQTAMAHGPGHFPGSALPGDPGNCALAGHSNVPGCAYFSGLHRLHVGSLIEIRTPTGMCRYQVINMHVVRPTNTRDVAPSRDARLTLVTCTLPDARNRLIVIAREVPPKGQAAPSPQRPAEQDLPETGRKKRH